MFENLPELYIVKKTIDSYRLIRYSNNILYISELIYDELDSDDLLILWIIMRDKYNLHITNVYNVYRKAFNEWKMYGKTPEKFINKLVYMINEYSRNAKLKYEHIEYIKQLNKQ